MPERIRRSTRYPRLPGRGRTARCRGLVQERYLHCQGDHVADARPPLDSPVYAVGGEERRHIIATTIAHWHGGELTLWSSCQHPFLVRQEIAALFGLPLDLVQVIVPFLGGGFGSKSYTKMEPLTAAIARKAGRPVRILNGVHESMITTKVVVRGTDTRYTPYDRSTGASRSTTVAGLAVQRAAQDVLDALLETAAVRLEAPPQLLTRPAALFTTRAAGR